MKFIPVKTRVMRPPQDDIYDLLNNDLPSLAEGDVVFITSKVLAIHQGRCVKIKTGTRAEKIKLAKQEADYYYARNNSYFLTIKDATFISSAGIDVSNGNGYYILWPRQVNDLLKDICNYLKKKHKLKKLAVVAVDSTSAPLRWGITGVAIGCFGLKPIKSHQGKKDIFGKKIKNGQVNILDALANMTNLIMGESNEQTPLLVGRGLKFIEFTNRQSFQNILVDIKDDYYYPLFKSFKKNK